MTGFWAGVEGAWERGLECMTGCWPGPSATAVVMLSERGRSVRSDGCGCPGVSSSAISTSIDGQLPPLLVVSIGERFTSTDMAPLSGTLWGDSRRRRRGAVYAQVRARPFLEQRMQGRAPSQRFLEILQASQARTDRTRSCGFTLGRGISGEFWGARVYGRRPRRKGNACGARG